jgi:hypothetical protein
VLTASNCRSGTEIDLNLLRDAYFAGPDGAAQFRIRVDSRPVGTTFITLLGGVGLMTTGNSYYVSYVYVEADSGADPPPSIVLG